MLIIACESRTVILKNWRRYRLIEVMLLQLQLGIKRVKLHKVTYTRSYLFSNHDIVLVVRIVSIPKFAWRRENKPCDYSKTIEFLA